MVFLDEKDDDWMKKAFKTVSVVIRVEDGTTQNVTDADCTDSEKESSQEVN